MNKPTKKLSLSRESIRSLLSPQLARAVGAGFTVGTDTPTCSINDPTTTGTEPSRALCSLPAPCGGSGGIRCY